MVNQEHGQALSNFSETYLMRTQVRKGQLSGRRGGVLSRRITSPGTGMTWGSRSVPGSAG